MKEKNEKPEEPEKPGSAEGPGTAKTFGEALEKMGFAPLDHPPRRIIVRSGQPGRRLRLSRRPKDED